MSIKAALFLLASSGTIPFPEYDVDAMCAAHYRNVVAEVAACVKTEQWAYDRVKYRWDDLTDVERQRAIEAAERHPGSKYVELEFQAVNILAAHLDEVYVPKFKR